MKYTALLPLAFTTLSFSMEAPSQSLQLKIAAAQQHNRILCPLARLPRDVQDMIAQYLEFNDRETDEESENEIKRIKKRYGNWQLGQHLSHLPIEMRVKYAGKETPDITVSLNGNTICYNLSHCPPPDAEKKFIDYFKPYKPSAELQVIYSRDKSKVIMAHEQRMNERLSVFYFIYDRKTDGILYAVKWTSHPSVRKVKVLAISNDGSYFSLLWYCTDHENSYGYVEADSSHPKDSYHPIATLRNNQPIPIAEFNKQSTRFYNKVKNKVYDLYSEQEHKQRSKKTLANYLHQKGICKPFNYTSIQ